MKWKNVIIVILLIAVVGLSAALHREKQYSKGLASQIPIIKWPEAIKGPDITDEFGMTYPDPCLRFPDDAVFPPVSEYIAKSFIPGYVKCANSQYEHVNELIAQRQWYRQHLNITLDLLEKKRSQVDIVNYERPDYTPFAIDPNHVEDEYGLAMILNETASKTYEFVDETMRGFAQIKECHKRLESITAEPISADN